MDLALKVDSAGKKFAKSLRQMMAYGAGDIAMAAIGRLPDTAHLRPGEFWAVDDISFELKRGEALGIIGPNGSGKTTLLRMLNGIFLPDKGRIEVRGKVGGLIHVGAGFHPMLSGRENIYVNAAILGMTRQEANRDFDAIVDLAGIGDFLDVPVKQYSSGMYVRLGFAVAVHCRPDILLIDEVLAVGDKSFQLRSYQKMHELRRGGATVVLVSHNEYNIREMTERCLYLSGGRPLFLGSSEEAVSLYLGDVYRARAADMSVAAAPVLSRQSAAAIQGLRFLSSTEDPLECLPSGASLTAEVTLEVEKPLETPMVGVNFYNEGGLVYCAHSDYEHVVLPALVPGTWKVRVHIPQCHLPADNYHCSVSLADEAPTNLVDLKNMAYTLTVTRPPDARGLMKFQTQWKVLPQGLEGAP